MKDSDQVLNSPNVGPNGHEAPDLEKRPSGYKTTTTESSKFIRKGEIYIWLRVCHSPFVMMVIWGAKWT